MNFQEAVAILAAESQQDLSPDADGLVQLECESDMTLTAFSPDGSQALYLTVSVMELPQPVDPAIYERMLKMNFLLMDTRGAALSLDEEGQQVHLCLCLPLEWLNAEALSGAVSGLIETASRVQAELHTSTSSAAGQTYSDEQLPFESHRV